MSSLVQVLAERVVGTVEEVSADKIIVLLDPDAPYATALNTGYPESFPRIHSYLLIPNEIGATVGWINSIKIERLPYPKRKGMQDFGLIDLPFPCRIVTLTPLGTLTYRTDSKAKENLVSEVRRGVDVFPSVGDPVLLPTPEQLRTIVEGESRENTGRILLGHCPTAAGARVYVDPNKLFGRHLAILGNTGSGKSCSVAGLIRWSLDAAKRERQKNKRSNSVNARFIILDPNGEYARAFNEIKENVRLFKVEVSQGDAAKQLKVPAWLWNGEEWAAFAGASPGVQRPILFEALRRLRSGCGTPNQFINRVRIRTKQFLDQLKMISDNGDYYGKGKRETFAELLQRITTDYNGMACDSACSDVLKEMLENAAEYALQLEKSRRGDVRDTSSYWHKDFFGVDVDECFKKIEAIARQIKLCDDRVIISEDTPHYFPVDELANYVDALASGAPNRDLTQFVDSLKLRIRGLMSREGLASILNPKDSALIKLEDWLTDYIGDDEASNGQIAVIDLSLVPSEVNHIVVAVLARLTFEALQRYRRENKKELPTVLVLEEAHTFINRDFTKEGAPAASVMCCRVFERIAREGRKFGLGLVLASQRPSELSPTVLSQCNTFLLHRLVNDRDQDLVKRLVPDGLSALLRELPSLPSRRAILLGWAAPAPVLVEIQNLPESQRPHSSDPAFWDVWVGDPDRGQRHINWEIIVRKWKEDTVPGENGTSGEEELNLGSFEVAPADDENSPF